MDSEIEIATENVLYYQCSHSDISGPKLKVSIFVNIAWKCQKYLLLNVIHVMNISKMKHTTRVQTFGKYH